jgi:hypothetical protein
MKSMSLKGSLVRSPLLTCHIPWFSSACSVPESSPVLPQVIPDCLKPDAIHPTGDSCVSTAQAPLPESDYLVPSHMQMHCSSVIPPPVVRPPRKDSSTVQHRVVFPPRESCYKCVCILFEFPVFHTLICEAFLSSLLISLNTAQSLV